MAVAPGLVRPLTGFGKPARLSLIALWGILVSCAPLLTETPRLTLVSVEPAGMTFLEQSFRVQIRIQNPTDTELRVDGLSFALELNDMPLLSGVSNRSFTVPRYGEAVTEASGVSTTLGLFRQIEAMQQGRTTGLSYRLRGRLSLAGRLTDIPFSQEGTIALPSTGAAPDDW